MKKIEILVLARVSKNKWLDKLASARVSFMHHESFPRYSRKAHLDAFRYLLMVVLCAKQNAKLLYMMIIYPVMHCMIGSSVEYSGDFVLLKYS